MTVKSGALVTALFSSCHPATGAAANADSLPTAVLYVNGVANAAACTVTNLATGLYKVVVTLPILASGDLVALVAAATVATFASVETVWQAAATTKLVSDLNDLAAGAAMTLTAAYDAAKTATSAPGVRAELTTELARIDTNIGSRSTYIGADTPGTSTLLARILGTLAAGTHQPQSGDAYARVGAAGAGLTGVGDTRLANLDATVSSRARPADVPTMITPQAVRDALLLAPTAPGSGAAGSIDTKLGAIPTNPYTGTPPTKEEVSTQVAADLAATHGSGTWAGDPWSVDPADANAYPAGTAGYRLANIEQHAGLITTGTALTVAGGLTAGAMRVTATVSYSETLTGLVIPADWIRLYLTWKTTTAPAAADAQAPLQMRVSNPGAAGDGLLVLNGAAGTAGQGRLTPDRAAGTLGIALTDEATASLLRYNGVDLTWDVKCLRASGDSDRLALGTASVALGETQALA